jgi:hypothetical protein
MHCTRARARCQEMQWHMQIQIMRAANKMDLLQKQIGLWKCMAFACIRNINLPGSCECMVAARDEECIQHILYYQTMHAANKMDLLQEQIWSMEMYGLCLYPKYQSPLIMRVHGCRKGRGMHPTHIILPY